jgi:hypothetical protein
MGTTQNAPTPFQPPNQAGAANAFQQGAGALAQGGQQIQGIALPGFEQILQAFRNNPYYSGAQTNANTTGAAGMAFGQGEVNTGNQLQAMGGQLAGYAPGIAATAFDPQQQLYNQQFQQNQQQMAAINASNGVAGSPFGAGLEQQGAQQFNLGWQNNQQQRQLAGVQGLEGLAGATAGLDTAGANIGDQGLATMTQAGQLPNAVYQANQAAIDQALSSLVSGDNAAFATTQQSVADQGQYLNIGQTAAQGAIQAAQVNNQASQAFSSGLGSLFGDVLGMFSFSPIKI